jgi:hypothetical protein
MGFGFKVSKEVLWMQGMVFLQFFSIISFTQIALNTKYCKLPQRGASCGMVHLIDDVASCIMGSWETLTLKGIFMFFAINKIMTRGP